MSDDKGRVPSFVERLYKKTGETTAVTDKKDKPRLPKAPAVPKNSDSPVEEDLYADPGLPALPISAGDMPSAEEMQSTLDTALGTATPVSEMAPILTRDTPSSVEVVIPTDTMSVSSDLEDVKSDMMILSSHHKEMSGKMMSLEGELKSLRYDMNTMSTQIDELIREIKRGYTVESSITQREKRDAEKEDPISISATVDEIQGDIRSVRQDFFTGKQEDVSKTPRVPRRHRGE